jgi:plastocyanin
MRIRRDLIVLSFTSLVASCGGNDTTAPPPPDNTVASVSVAPAAPADLDEGATLAFAATAKNAAGAVLSGKAFTWQTSDASVLSLSATTGTSITATAVKAGTATVTVTAESKSGTASVTIVQAPAVKVTANANFTFTPATATIHAGESVEWTGLNDHDVEFKTTGSPQDVGFVGTGRRTFPTPGTYDYVCGPHESLGMTGQVVVEP